MCVVILGDVGGLIQPKAKPIVLALRSQPQVLYLCTTLVTTF